MAKVPSQIHDCFLPDCRQPPDGGGAAAVPEAARARDDALRDQPGGLRPPLLRRQPPPHRRTLHPQGVDPRTGHMQVSKARPGRTMVKTYEKPMSISKNI